MKMEPQKPMDEWEAIENVPDALKLKTIYAMITRSTMIAIANNFHLMALINQLHDKGVIDKSLVEQEAGRGGAEIMKELLRMSDEMEKDIEAESKQIYMMKKQDAAMRSQMLSADIPGGGQTESESVGSASTDQSDTAPGGGGVSAG
jgi:hypothetical protein